MFLFTFCAWWLCVVLSAVEVSRAAATGSDGSWRGPSAFRSTDQRASLCDRLIAVSNGSVAIRDALQGAHLTAATTLWDDSWMGFDNSSGTYTGFESELLHAVAEKGSFTFTIEHYPINSTWEAWLMEAVDLFDFSTVYFSANAERAAKGVITPHGLVDVSGVLVTNSFKEKVGFWKNALQCFTPFHWTVWVTLMGVSLGTGILYWVFERHDNDVDLPHKRCKGMLQSVFLAYLQITGSGGYSPKTWHGKLLLISWAWCVLLVVSAYTANLAKYLVVQEPLALPFDGIDSAIRSGTRLCVWGGTSQAAYFSRAYPTYQNIYWTAGDPLLALKAGQCHAAVVAKVEYDLAIDNNAMNPNCDLTQVGGHMNVEMGGWMVGSDYHEKCTALVKDVLEVLLLEVEADGTLRRVYHQLQESKRTRAQPCTKETIVIDVESADFSLQIDSMSGIFVIHALGCACAIISCALHHPRKHLINKVKGSSSMRASGSSGSSECLEDIALPSSSCHGSDYVIDVGNDLERPVMQHSLGAIEIQESDLANISGQTWRANTLLEKIPHGKPIVTGTLHQVMEEERAYVTECFYRAREAHREALEERVMAEKFWQRAREERSLVDQHALAAKDGRSPVVDPLAERPMTDCNRTPRAFDRLNQAPMSPALQHTPPGFAKPPFII